jgi:hypothetical protein
MRKNKKNGQVEVEPFVPPEPIVAGSEQARYARHRAKFAKQTFDLEQENRRASLVAFKVWHRRQQDQLPKESLNSAQSDRESRVKEKLARSKELLARLDKKYGKPPLMSEDEKEWRWRHLMLSQRPTARNPKNK